MAATFCRNFLSFPFCRLCDTGVNLSNLKVWEHPGENKRQKTDRKFTEMLTISIVPWPLIFAKFAMSAVFSPSPN